MPYNNFCSFYPLLRRDEQDGHYFHAQHKPHLAKKVFSGEGGTGMGRLPHSHADGSSSFKKGPWTAEEDAALLAHVSLHGYRNWNAVRRYAGISRCGKSCRLRWTNHLRPNLRKGPLQRCEELLIIQQHALLGNRWSRIAAMLPGRTDNEVKNFWNTRKKRFQRAGLPLHPDNDRVSSVEDAKGDVCETYLKYDPDGTASSKKLTHSWNSPSSACNDVLGPRTYSAVNIMDSKVKVADLMPGFDILDRGDHSLEHARDTQIIGKMSKHNTVSPLKEPSPVGGSSFYDLSDGVMAQPLSYLHGNYTIGSHTVLPHAPCSSGDCSSCFGSPRATGVSSGCGTAGSSTSVSNTPISMRTTSSDLFSSFKQGDFLACLNAELPSVQIAKSANSSSVVFSPHATVQVLSSSESDRLNFTSETSRNKKTGSLIDILLQMKAPSQGQMQANMTETTAIASPINACATAQSVENLLWKVDYNSHPCLDGWSPTFPNVNLSTALQATDLCSLGLCAGPPLLMELPTGGEAFQLSRHMQGEICNDSAINYQASAHQTDEELVTATGSERLKGFCGLQFLGERPYTGAWSEQAEKIVMDPDGEMTSGVECSEGTSEFGLGEVNSNLVDDGMVSSSMKAGAWVWSYMPGILQAGNACDDT